MSEAPRSDETLSQAAVTTAAELVRAARVSRREWLGLGSRLARLGIRPETPQADAKYIVLTNTCALLGLAAVALTLILGPTPELATLPGLAAAIVALCFVLWLNARARHLAASVCLNVLAVMATGAQTFVTGPGVGLSLYMVLLVIVPFVTVPPGGTVLALGCATAAGAAYVASVFGYELIAAAAPATGGDRQIERIVNSSIVVGLLVAVGHYARAVARIADERIAHKRAQTEQLLHRILPASVAARLQGGEVVIADQHDDVSVVVSDIVGFTSLSETMPPGQLVRLLDDLFRAFDRLCERHGVEKLKTIGDAYLAIAGLTGERDHADQAVQLGLDMISIVRHHALRRGLELSIRVGVSTGPLITGVVGTTRISYDARGETMLVASSLEQQGSPGAVKISAATRDRLDPARRCEPAGEIVTPSGARVDAFLVRES
ncbi:MAG: adenylate/guanylate cyclase domain-containing protein [Nannocystaceae bacterium]|nr:hypothetical protein [Myxococcales bacterium]